MTLSDPASGNGSRTLPLILAGPMLRHVASDSVTVWIALQHPRTVYLRILEFSELIPTPTEHTLTAASTIELGPHLHVACVTAHYCSLEAHTIYGYDLKFGNLDGTNQTSWLFKDDVDGLLGAGDYQPTLVYDNWKWPTFSLSPIDLNDLRIVHGSCRKPHGEGADALAACDIMIERANAASSDIATFAQTRPHLLFLSGDQIYADDVANDLLSLLTNIACTVMEEEKLPNGKKLSDYPPGERLPYINSTFTSIKKAILPDSWVNDDAGLSSGHADSHLIGFGEFCAMYLCVWSNALWPSVDGLTGSTSGETKERKALKSFLSDLPRVRRALANIPVYMIFDDHDVTDDWYLTRKWTERAVSSAKGVQIIENGLLSFAVFQAWGNVPEPFSIDSPGDELLRAIDSKSPNQFPRETLKNLLNIPSFENGYLEWPIANADVDCIPFYFRIARGNAFEVLVLDTRTQRGFGGDIEPPHLLSNPSLIKQLEQTSAMGTQKLTFVVSPVPLWPHPVADLAQDHLSFPAQIMEKGSQDSIESIDNEHWRLQPSTMQRFLAKLAVRNQSKLDDHPKRIVILSGDVHYALATTAHYWAKKPYKQSSPGTKAIFVNFVASGCKNEDSKTRTIGALGYGSVESRSSPIIDDNNSSPEYLWAGWEGPITEAIRNAIDPSSTMPYDDNAEGPGLIEFDNNSFTLSNLTQVQHPDWLFRVDYLPGMQNKFSPLVLDCLDDTTPEMVGLFLTYNKYMNVIGGSNVGEIVVDWGTIKTIKQRTWWSLENDNAQSGPCPATEHEAELELIYPIPEINNQYFGGGGDDGK